MVDWHRLFGLGLCDLFLRSPWIVELEKDLAQRVQLLDVAIIRRGQGGATPKLPDGLEDLADHNLLTYKSLHEPLDDWALKELTGHYVNYRKQTSGDGELLPEESLRLFGVSTRFPQKLSGQLPLERRQAGVYSCRRGTDLITVIVLAEMPQLEHNSFWLLFSAKPDEVRYGASRYERHSSDMNAVLERLFVGYQMENVTMPYTLEDFRREYLQSLSVDERLQGLSPDVIESYLEKLRAERQRHPRGKSVGGSRKKSKSPRRSGNSPRRKGPSN